MERAVGPGVTTTQVTEWIIDRIGKHRRQTDRKRHSYSIAKAGRVVAGRESIVVRDAHLDRSALFQQRTHPGLDRCPVDRTSLKIKAVERPEPSQHIVKLIGVACPAAIDQQLEFELKVSEHLGIEQLTKLLRAEHVAQQLPIERQRRCSALGDRGVAFVHVDGDPREQQRLRKRGRLIGVDRHHAHLAASQIRHHRTQSRQVEHVVDALAGGFEQHREGRILGGHVEQIGGPLTLLPQRGALIGPTTRQQQCPGGTLAEASGEHRRIGQARNNDVVDLIGVKQQLIERQPIERLRQPHHDAVIAPHEIDLAPPLLTEPGLQRHRPRGVNLRTERRERAHPPIADLVAEAFDDDRAIVGHDTGGLGLVGEVGEQVLGGEIVETVALLEALDRCLFVELTNFTHERTDRPAKLQRPARPIAVPERHLAGNAWRRGDDHPFVGDVLDPPRRGAKQERLPHPALVDHLLVELTDPSAVREEHPEQTPIGNRACIGDRKPLRARPPPKLTGDAIPHDPRPQLGELLARIRARQQIEHVAEHLIGQITEVRAAADQVREISELPVVHRAHRHELLSEHVERVAREVRLLDQPLMHAVDDNRRFEQISSMLREDLADARLTDLMTGPTDALHARRHRAGRRNLHHKVDRTHVDAEFQRRRGDEPLQVAPLEFVLDLESTLPGERTVVSLHQLLALRSAPTDLFVAGAEGRRWRNRAVELARCLFDRKFVEAGREPLRQAAGVGEHKCRAVLLDQLEEPWMHRRPDRTAGVGRGRRRCIGAGLDALAEVGHVLDRNHDLDLQFFTSTGINNGDRTR